jgi:hypothetical protein
MLENKKIFLIITLSFFSFLTSNSSVVPMDKFVETWLQYEQFESIPPKLSEQFIKTFPSLVGKERELYNVFNGYYNSLEKVNERAGGYCVMQVPDHALSWCGCCRGPNYSRLYLTFKLLNDVCIKFPDKTQRLVITSFCSGYILQELFCVLGLVAMGYKNIVINLIDPIYVDPDPEFFTFFGHKLREDVKTLSNDFEIMLAQYGKKDFLCECRFYTDYRAYMKETFDNPDLKSNVMMLIDPEFGFYVDECLVINIDSEVLKGKQFGYLKQMVEAGPTRPLFTDLEVVKVDLTSEQLSEQLAAKFFLSFPFNGNGWVVKSGTFGGSADEYLSGLVHAVSVRGCDICLPEATFRNELLSKERLYDSLPKNKALVFVRKMRNAYKEFAFLVKHTAVEGALIFELAVNDPSLLLGDSGSMIHIEELCVGEFGLRKDINEWMKDYTDLGLQTIAQGQLGANFPFGCSEEELAGRRVISCSIEETILEQIIRDVTLKNIKRYVCRPTLCEHQCVETEEGSDSYSGGAGASGAGPHDDSLVRALILLKNKLLQLARELSVRRVSGKGIVERTY